MEQDPKEELLRIRAREKRYKADEEARMIADLLAQLAALTEVKDRAKANRTLTMVELEKRVTELEEESAALKMLLKRFNWGKAGLACVGIT